MIPLEFDALVRAAANHFPDSDFGPYPFEDALRALLDGLCGEARLTQIGVMIESEQILRALERRRYLSRLLHDHPEVYEVAIPAPVVIVGFPRTGTTLLHNLLAAIPGHRTIRKWEMNMPVPPPGAPQNWIDIIKRETAKEIDLVKQHAPWLADIHPVGADYPDECHLLFRNSFASSSYTCLYHMPSYARWLGQQDNTDNYAYYRLQLQAILFQRPGEPLILKDPSHTGRLPALMKVLPDARVIHLHRDLDEVVGSFASLCRSLQQGTGEGRTNEVIGVYAADLLAGGMNRILAARRELAGKTIIDLPYTQLAKDPLGTVAALQERLGLVWNSEAENAVATWLTEGKVRSGQHRYDLSEFGLDAKKLRERFAPYLDAYGEFLPIPGR